ncbi:MAG: flagellar biosynthesis protein FlhB [Pseudomonadota bacterium]
MPRGKDNEKTEPATPKRREEARKKGQVAQSREIPTIVVLLGSLLVFYFFGSYMIHHLSVMIQGILDSIGTLQLDETNVYHFLLGVLRQMAVLLAPLMLAVMVAGIGGNILQKGFLFTADPLIPKLSKVNPIKGVAKMFSTQSLMETAKSIAKIAIVGYIAFVTVKAERENFLPLMMMETGGVLAYIGEVSFKICVRTLWVLIPLGILDYAFQRWDYEQNLKMSKQEVKDEFKQREGDPLIKARIRSIQREMAQRRMMAEIPKADVVITNPTELAVALRYDSETMPAPKVVAKGAGFVAERIREKAVLSGVLVVENKPLAKSLFKLVDIGQYIPAALYKAVAEVLAYVYRLRRVRGA